MSNLKPTDQMPDKINKNADQAVKSAWSLLFVNGFITESEACRIDNRIEKWEKDFYRDINTNNE